MTHSESIKIIAPALLAAQKLMGAAKKDAENPYFHSTYADLGAVMQVCKEPLNTNGITILQPVGIDENGGYVETILLHESGEFITDKTRITAKSANNPQDQGSAITYARRYGLQSMLFIPAEDDDGERATAPLRKPHIDDDGITHEPVANGVKAPTQPITNHFCTIHNKPMKERTSTKGGTWYDHRWQDANKVWQQCNGMPKTVDFHEGEEPPPFSDY